MPPKINTDYAIDQQIEEACKALALREVYQRAGRLVHVVREPVKRENVIELTGQPRLRELPRVLLFNELELGAEWFTWGPGANEQESSPPTQLRDSLHELGSWRHIRPLRGIASWPILRSDGSIVCTNGYDAETAYLLAGLPKIDLPSAPTQADARAALGVLLDVIADFPITSAAERAVWIAAVLTLIARPAIAGPVPAFYFDATAPGSGKTLLANSAARIVLNEAPPAQAAPSQDDEWQRTMTAICAGAAPAVLFDNLRGRVASAALEAVLTSGKFAGRRMRTTEMVETDVTAVFFLTGNGAEITVDLARRSLHCRLVPDTERPELRAGFKHPHLTDHIRASRSSLLAAALTIFRAYSCAGRPSVEMRGMGSFEQWSKHVRAPLIWAGAADPVTTQDELRETMVTELDEASELFGAWFEALGDRVMDVHDLLSACSARKDDPKFQRLMRALGAACQVPETERPEVRKVGALLKKHRDRIISSAQHRLRITMAGKSNLGARWRVAQAVEAAA